jgi:nucleotide-binding universal stress UspA family protein
MTENSWLTPPIVVLGTDGSETAKRAANVAVAIAKKHQAALHIITVVRPPEGWWGVVGSPPTPQAVADALTKAQREIIDGTLAGVETDGLEVATVEEIGDPASVLIDYCADEGAGLLVVGKRGAGLMERLIMGSVADRVAHGAHCPVLVVP